MTDQPRGPIDWARHQQAERETRQTTNPAATELLHRYRDWLATQHANAVRADRAGGVPDDLKISPHNGIAAGLHTALLGLDRLLDVPDAEPTVRECAEADAHWWADKYAGEGQ